MQKSLWFRAACAGLAIAVIAVAWTTYAGRRAAEAAIAAVQDDVQREWTAQYRRFVDDLDRDEYAPEWKQGLLNALKAGTDSMRAGEYTAAAAAFGKAQSDDPNNPYLLTLRGWAFLRAGDAITAAKYFDAAVFVHPDYAWGYYQLAVAQCASGDPLGAREAAAAALASSPSLDRIVKLDSTLTAKCPAAVK